MMRENKYLQVDLDFYDTINSCVAQNQNLKVFYFNQSSEVMEAKGFFLKIENTREGEFLLVADTKVRLDSIITINGKLGPAYEAYDKLSQDCSSCLLGYES